MALKFYTSVAKGWKLKVTKFWGVNPTFVEDTGEQLVGGRGGGDFLLPILNRVKRILIMPVKPVLAKP